MLRVGSQFLIASVGEDMLAKVANSQETHGAPPGLYLVLFFATFFPASMLAGLAAPAVWAVRREPAARFLLAWLVPSWIVFELVVTKLPHYVLPLYPAIAILIAGAVETKVLSRRPWLVRGAMWWFLVPIIVSILAVVAAIMIDRDLVLLAWPFFAGRDRLRPLRLAVLRSGRRRARLPARHGGVGVDGVRRLWRGRALARDGFPERGARPGAAQFRLRASGRRQRRL